MTTIFVFSRVPNQWHGAHVDSKLASYLADVHGAEVVLDITDDSRIYVELISKDPPCRSMGAAFVETTIDAAVRAATRMRNRRLRQYGCQRARYA